jgi:hypothetical protein
MSKFLSQVVENRRKELISKLIAFNLYKKEHLFELTLTDLENEFKKIQSNVHPHGGMDSIHWTNINS